MPKFHVVSDGGIEQSGSPYDLIGSAIVRARSLAGIVPGLVTYRVYDENQKLVFETDGVTERTVGDE